MSLLTANRPLISTLNGEPEGWRRNTPCGFLDPDLWWSTNVTEQGLARHVCLNHCPVLAACQAWYHPSSGGETAGGYTYRFGGKLKKVQPRVASSCTLCRPKVDTTPRG